MRPRLIPEEESIKTPFLASVVILIIAAILIGLRWNRLPPEVPLYFSLPWGETQLAKTIFLGLPIALSLILLAVNLSLISIFESSFLKKVLIFGSLATSIMAAITIVRIIFLIT